jgi:hypothetical protein
MLDIEVWDKASDARRHKTVAAVLSKLRKQRDMQLSAPRWEHCGPPGSQRPIAVVVDEPTGVEFCLVPGGWFTPGLDTAHAKTLVELMERYDRSPYPYDTSVPWTVCAAPKQRVPIRPFLVARFPLTHAMTGLDACRSKDGPAWRNQAPDNDREFAPLVVDEIDAVTSRFHWEVPQAVYLEWAISGGARDVFYWGDDLDYAAMSDEGPRHPLLRIDDPGETPWPGTNAFGLRGAVAVPQWCWLAEAEGKRLYVRGGAGYCAPWQRCGEMLWLVNFMVAPWDTFGDERDEHALRPMIPL